MFIFAKNEVENDENGKTKNNSSKSTTNDDKTEKKTSNSTRTTTKKLKNQKAVHNPLNLMVCEIFKLNCKKSSIFVELTFGVVKIAEKWVSEPRGKKRYYFCY